MENAILTILQQSANNGDSYLPLTQLYHIWQRKTGMYYDEFCSEMTAIEEQREIYCDCANVYLRSSWEYEETVSEYLQELLCKNEMPADDLPFELSVDNINLCDEQRDAVRMALSHRISMIIGGAGCGKTSVIGAIAEHAGDRTVTMLAPTGKAARNLADRTGRSVNTIHRMLHVYEGMSFMDVEGELSGIIVVDEAGMVSYGMLAGLFRCMSDDASIVLLGDPNQLQSVGTGDVIADLLKLGVPCAVLQRNHRQEKSCGALLHNVLMFNKIRSAYSLAIDDDFRVCVSDDPKVCMNALVREAVGMYLSGESVQVLAYEKSAVAEINRRIQEKVNPFGSGKLMLEYGGKCFVTGSRVLIGENDHTRGVCNGDIGRMDINPSRTSFSVTMEDGRAVQWKGDDMKKGLRKLELAYATTVHKAQGSEYDTVLFYVRGHVFRNLMYTAISRARKSVALYGSLVEIDRGLWTSPPMRKTTLVERVSRDLSVRAAS